MSGELLGMDMDGVVEITESFPHPAGSQEESDVIEYQNEMIRTLKEAHVDQTLVGWYQCSSLESWLTPSFIDTQSLYQSNIPNSIILVIDVLRSSRGFPCVKAFRLKDEFIAMFREKRNKNPALQGNAEIFNELPVSLKLSSLDQLFLLQAVETNAIPVVGVPQVPEIDDLLLRIKGNSILSSTEDVLSEAGRLQHQIRNTVKQNQTFNSQLLRLIYENSQRIQAGEGAKPSSLLVNSARTSVESSRVPFLLASSSLRVAIAPQPGGVSEL